MRPLLTLMCLFPLLSTGGCATAQVVEMRTGQDFADPDPRRGGGHVRYQLDVAQPIIARRRTAAYRKMRAHCKGAYEVVRDWVEGEPTGVIGYTLTEQQTSASMASGVTMASVITLRARNLEFRCRPDVEVPPDHLTPVAWRASGSQ